MSTLFCFSNGQGVCTTSRVEFPTSAALRERRDECRTRRELLQDFGCATPSADLRTSGRLRERRDQVKNSSGVASGLGIVGIGGFSQELVQILERESEV